MSDLTDTQKRTIQDCDAWCATANLPTYSDMMRRLETLATAFKQEREDADRIVIRVLGHRGGRTPAGFLKVRDIMNEIDAIREKADRLQAALDGMRPVGYSQDDRIHTAIDADVYAQLSLDGKAEYPRALFDKPVLDV